MRRRHRGTALLLALLAAAGCEQARRYEPKGAPPAEPSRPEPQGRSSQPPGPLDVSLAWVEPKGEVASPALRFVHEEADRDEWARLPGRLWHGHLAAPEQV